MRRFVLVVMAAGVALLAASFASSQETKDQQESLALLAKIDGKVKFDPMHPKRVVAIDI